MPAMNAFAVVSDSARFRRKAAFSPVSVSRFLQFVSGQVRNAPKRLIRLASFLRVLTAAAASGS
jgi:hypothetical protein